MCRWAMKQRSSRLGVGDGRGAPRVLAVIACTATMLAGSVVASGSNDATPGVALPATAQIVLSSGADGVWSRTTTACMRRSMTARIGCRSPRPPCAPIRSCSTTCSGSRRSALTGLAARQRKCPLRDEARLHVGCRKRWRTTPLVPGPSGLPSSFLPDDANPTTPTFSSGEDGWILSSTGPRNRSGLFRTSDGGAHWFFVAPAPFQ